MRNIGLHEDGLGAQSGYLAQSRLAGRFLNVGQHQPRAFLGEADGDRFADAGADPGNDGYLVSRVACESGSDGFETGAGASSRLEMTRSIMPYSMACSALMM